MKKLAAIILTAIIVISIFALVAGAYAMPLMKWRNVMQNDNNHRVAAQQSFVRVDGLVTHWGTTNVTGTMMAQWRTVIVNASTVREGASATFIWTNNSRPINAMQTKTNFTFTFYTARLIAPDTESLNVSGTSFFLNGTWNVYQVTTNFTITTDSSGAITSVNRNQTAAPLAATAYGEFKVSENATRFTLSIAGVNDLTGVVHVQRITTRMFNPFMINNVDSQTTVTRQDMASLISAYGSSPGWGNYDQRMDYNFNYKVDICDLATAAANLNA